MGIERRCEYQGIIERINRVALERRLQCRSQPGRGGVIGQDVLRGRPARHRIHRVGSSRLRVDTVGDLASVCVR